MLEQVVFVARVGFSGWERLSEARAILRRIAGKSHRGGVAIVRRAIPLRVAGVSSWREPEETQSNGYRDL